MNNLEDLINEKYEYQQILTEKKLNDSFSTEFLGYLRSVKNLSTFNEINSFSGAIDDTFLGYDLTGIKYLPMITTLRVRKDGANSRKLVIDEIGSLTELTDLRINYAYPSNLGDISNLKNLASLQLIGNDLSFIGHLDNLTNLTSINISDNNLSGNSKTFSDISGLLNLVTVDLNNNDISGVGNINNLSNLTRFNIHNNSLSTGQVDIYLTQLNGLMQAHGNLSECNLSGNSIPTNGESNQDYLDLLSAGVNITIDY